jgi:hypothetical protein
LSTAFTEAEMSRLLDQALDSGKLRIHERTISNWVTELTARNGVADFVLTPTSLSGPKLEWARKLAAGISSPAAAGVVAALNSTYPTSVDVIAKRADLSRSTVSRVIRQLTAGGVAWGDSANGIRLLHPVRESDVELWAYELKLRDWRHGMYQALQYRAFAHSVAIVLPQQAAKIVISHLGRFRAYNVGVMIFDPKTGHLRVLVRPKRSKPGSMAHYLFALAGFIRSVSEGSPRADLSNGPRTPSDQRVPGFVRVAQAAGGR